MNVGIIGGADGPTSIVVSGDFDPFSAAAAVILLIAAAGTVFWIVKKRKRK